MDGYGRIPEFLVRETERSDRCLGRGRRSAASEAVAVKTAVLDGHTELGAKGVPSPQPWRRKGAPLVRAWRRTSAWMPEGWPCGSGSGHRAEWRRTATHGLALGRGPTSSRWHLEVRNFQMK